MKKKKKRRRLKHRQGHIIGVMAALSILHALINSVSTAWLAHITKTYAVFHIGILVSCCVALLALQKDKNTATYAFTTVETNNGWSPPGFAFLFGFLSVAWAMPDDVLASAQPVAQIFFKVMGKGPAIFFTVAGFIIMNFVCITALQAGSRTVWAFSRDEMIPGYRVWYRIWRRTDTPVLAVWLYTLICILINVSKRTQPLSVVFPIGLLR